MMRALVNCTPLLTSVLLAGSLGACADDAVAVKALEVRLAATGTGSAGRARLYFWASEDSCTAAMGATALCPPMRLILNGLPVVLTSSDGTTSFVELTGGGFAGIDVPPDSYVASLEDQNGNELASSAAFELTSGTQNEIDFIGKKLAMDVHVYTDQLAGTGPNTLRARVLNGLDTHEAVQVRSCTDADVCAVLAESLAWGDAWEAVVPTGGRIEALVPTPAFLDPEATGPMTTVGGGLRLDVGGRFGSLIPLDLSEAQSSSGGYAPASILLFDSQP